MLPSGTLAGQPVSGYGAKRIDQRRRTTTTVGSIPSRRCPILPEIAVTHEMFESPIPDEEMRRFLEASLTIITSVEQAKRLRNILKRAKDREIGFDDMTNALTVHVPEAVGLAQAINRRAEEQGRPAWVDKGTVVGTWVIALATVFGVALQVGGLAEVTRVTKEHAESIVKQAIDELRKELQGSSGDKGSSE